MEFVVVSVPRFPLTPWDTRALKDHLPASVPLSLFGCPLPSCSLSLSVSISSLKFPLFSLFFLSLTPRDSSFLSLCPYSASHPPRSLKILPPNPVPSPMNWNQLTVHVPTGQGFPRAGGREPGGGGFNPSLSAAAGSPGGQLGLGLGRGGL